MKYEGKDSVGRKQLLAGIDVGSTTTKTVLWDDERGKIVFSSYERHHADQMGSIQECLKRLAEAAGGAAVRICLTGSGARPAAKALNAPFVQEVAAGAMALQRCSSRVGTAIELGGQDAKMVFFKYEKGAGGKVRQTVADMRMNGSCAGGTGAFIDEIAAVLKVPVEEFNALAERGTTVYDISGRCGVYAKTDIQPLLNQGASREDLALSAFHAIAKQTIGGLAQGLEIEKPVAFQGGPLTFNPMLVRVFEERLGLSGGDALIPEKPELMVALGAALALKTMFPHSRAQALSEIIEKIKNAENAENTKNCRTENCRTENCGTESPGRENCGTEGCGRENEGIENERIENSAGEETGTKAGPRGGAGKPFFSDENEKQRFLDAHRKPSLSWKRPEPGQMVCGYLGIDAGSTTTKFVLMGRDGEILDSFYAPNGGDPLKVARDALIGMREKYRAAGAQLKILAAGSTGYGEMLFAKAFGLACHTVETVAHARASREYAADASFILDIGGQDMKAIWLENGVITNILLNEACSSGCGSFLENFASSLGIAVQDIAGAAFQSRHPAVLGSRCTVFMNSSIITEQRNGRSAQDIMAGLCRSIIENVFTKVIRVSNLDSLGKKIVVQGGTFENDAVLKAMEEYVGRPVTRAPYPGIMGAIGAALIAAGRAKDQPEPCALDLDALDEFSWEQTANSPCPFCANHCRRTVVRFSNGSSWVTNNRCERGEILGDPADESVRQRLAEKSSRAGAVPDLFKVREELLFRAYPYPEPKTARGITVGIPRVLSFWDTMPFWTTFWKALGFGVVISGKSTRKLYESGLAAVASDTVCFPAKLVHGHIRDLAARGADGIFMPSITAMPPENHEKTSESMCAVVKGYPMVIRNSDNPERLYGIPLYAPLFHWHTVGDRDFQLIRYMRETFGIGKGEVLAALDAADQAQHSFRSELVKNGQAVMEKVKREGTFAVVLAARPYQNDALVNHDLPSMFTRAGIPVVTADSLPQVNETDLKMSRLDIVNNYHARMLSSAILAAGSDCLEYVQLVSFGCGHDAYLSDEIIRLMREISGKTPLILKVDESDVQGPLGIRVRSFLETVAMGRGKKREVHPLSEPYPVKFTRESRKERVVLVPNTSHAFCRVMSAALSSQGIRAVPLSIGGEDAIGLGKKYVHNDICFPAQVVIGEALAALESGKYDVGHVAIGMGKYVGDCRLTHYGALLRKALDDAGYEEVPILTNDDEDSHGLHPGFRMNAVSAARIAFALPMIDILEELLRKMRPYELEAGSADRAFEAAMDQVIGGLETAGISGAKRGFKRAVEIMGQVAYDRSHIKPRVLIVGEYLLNFHPGANHDIEAYLEKNGFEVIEARMTDVIRKTYFYQDAQNREYHLKRPAGKKLWFRAANKVFDLAHHTADALAASHPLYEPACRMDQLVKGSDPVIHHTFDAGEGVLIPGEIIHHASHGCRYFLILQPFGCLPNHVVGRGIAKRLKEMYPEVQILPLDYDPDMSFANIENRLQMLVMNARQEEAAAAPQRMPEKAEETDKARSRRGNAAPSHGRGLPEYADGLGSRRKINGGSGGAGAAAAIAAAMSGGKNARHGTVS